MRQCDAHRVDIKSQCLISSCTLLCVLSRAYITVMSLISGVMKLQGHVRPVSGCVKLICHYINNIALLTLLQGSNILIRNAKASVMKSWNCVRPTSGYENNTNLSCLYKGVTFSRGIPRPCINWISKIEDSNYCTLEQHFFFESKFIFYTCTYRHKSGHLMILQSKSV